MRKNKEPKLSKAEIKKQQEEAERFGNEMVESYRKQMDKLVETFRRTLKENLARQIAQEQEEKSEEDNKKT